MSEPSPLTEDQVDEQFRLLWARRGGRPEAAPSVRDLWREQCRVADLDQQPEPTLDEVVAHFSWFFTPPQLDEHGRWVEEGSI